MNDNYFQKLFYCIAVSFVLLIAAHVLLHSPWMSLLAGCGPLAYYHLGYLAPRASKGLTQASIDSVYYFGFLVTIAALGISAVTIASNEAETDLNKVVFQFGVGLFATGYAVVARMHLSSISATVDAASPEAILDKYIKRSMELVDNVEIAVVRTREFSQTILTQTSDIAEKAHADATQAMLDSARAFKDELNSTLGLARDGITEIRGLVSETSFVVEREELARSIKATVEASIRLNAALDDFAVKARAGAEVTGQTAIASESLEHQIRVLVVQLSNLSGEDGVLNTAAAAIGMAAESMSVGTRKIAETVDELEGIATSVADTGPTFTKMRTHARKAQEQLDALSSVTERLDLALSGMTGAADFTKDFAQYLRQATDSFPALSQRADSLANSFEMASHASARIQTTLDALPYQTKTTHELSEEIVQALKLLTAGVTEAAKQSEYLKGNTSQASAVIAGAQQLLANAGSMQASVQALQKQIDNLGASVEATQTKLVDSSSAIKDAVSTSADVLQADVKRSSDAAALLTSKLIAVAQGIIDQTRQRTEASV